MHLFLILNTRIYPFVDLPNHMAIGTIIRFYGDETNQFAKYYALDLFPKPNVFYAFFCSLKIFPSVEFANRVLLSLYVILLPLSVLLIIKKLGGNLWFSMLSFLLLYNYSLNWGFAGFSMALPFILLLFYLLIDYAENDSPRIWAAIALLLVLLFFMHVLSLLFALFFFYVLCFYRCGFSPGPFLRNGLIALPSLILILLWKMVEAQSADNANIFQYILYYYRKVYFQTLWKRSGLLVFDNDQLFAGFPGYLVALLFSLAIIAPLLYVLVTNREAGKSVIRDSKLAPLHFFFLCALAMYLFFPASLPGYSYLFARFSVIVLIAVIIEGSMLKTERFRQAGLIACCLLILLHFTLWAQYFSDFKRQNRSFTEEVFPDNPQNDVLAGFIFDHLFRGKAPYVQFLDYYIIWKRGVATTRFLHSRSFPVTAKPAPRPLPVYNEWIALNGEYHGEYRDIEYLLVKGDVPEEAATFLGDYTVFKTSGKWSLFKKGDPDTRFTSNHPDNPSFF